MKLLLTGFEPFGDFATNPSWDALHLAARQDLFDAEVILARIPVTYASAFETWQTAAKFGPAAGISFGLHGGIKGRGAATIYIETTARNRDGATKADNAGITRAAQPIAASGPATIAATFPAQALCDSLKDAGFDAQLSDDAGAYLCNHLFYQASLDARFPYGFVHVPPVDSMGGMLSLSDMARAMATLANTLARKIGKH
jgi:pyroglutamyl-peptidase